MQKFVKILTSVIVLAKVHDYDKRAFLIDHCQICSYVGIFPDTF